MDKILELKILLLFSSAMTAIGLALIFDLHHKINKLFYDSLLGNVNKKINLSFQEMITKVSLNEKLCGRREGQNFIIYFADETCHIELLKSGYNKVSLAFIREDFLANDWIVDKKIKRGYRNGKRN